MKTLLVKKDVILSKSLNSDEQCQHVSKFNTQSLNHGCYENYNTLVYELSKVT